MYLSCRDLTALGRPEDACRLLKFADKPRTFVRAVPNIAQASAPLLRKESRTGAGHRACRCRCRSGRPCGVRNLRTRTNPETEDEEKPAENQQHDGFGSIQGLHRDPRQKTGEIGLHCNTSCDDNTEQRAIQRRVNLTGPTSGRFSSLRSPTSARQWSLVPCHSDFRHPRLPSGRPMESPSVDKIEERNPIPSKGWASKLPFRNILLRMNLGRMRSCGTGWIPLIGRLLSSSMGRRVLRISRRRLHSRTSAGTAGSADCLTAACSERRPARRRFRVRPPAPAERGRADPPV